MTSKSCLEHWSRCAKTHRGRNVSMQAPDEPFAKFPGTCKSQVPAHIKSSCGFGALDPCGAAPLAHPPFPNGFQQALTISKLRADSGARCTAISSLPTYKSSPRLGQPWPSVTAKHPQSPQRTAGRETPNQGRRALQEEERMDEGVGRRGGKEITFTARERSLS